MSGRLWLFSSKIERDAAFPYGVPDDVRSGIAGVGLIDAAILTVESIAVAEPDEIVYLGTCGAYPGSGLNVGAIVAGESVVLGSGDTVDGSMRIPKLLPSGLTFDPELTHRLIEGLASVVKARVVCTLGVSETAGLASALGGLGEVENLEAFSILRAAGAIPVAAILGVTNHVGEDGGKEWGANYREMMERIVSLLRLT